jgi:hypothetical protein
LTSHAHCALVGWSSDLERKRAGPLVCVCVAASAVRVSE